MGRCLRASRICTVTAWSCRGRCQTLVSGARAVPEVGVGARPSQSRRQQEDTLPFQAEPDECFSRSPSGPSTVGPHPPAPPTQLSGLTAGSVTSTQRSPISAASFLFRACLSEGRLRFTAKWREHMRSAPHGLSTRQPCPAAGLPVCVPEAQLGRSGPHQPPPHHMSGLPAHLALPHWSQLFSVPRLPFPGGPVAGITESEAFPRRCLSPGDLRVRLLGSSSGLDGSLVSRAEYNLPSGCWWCSLTQLCV